MRFNDLLGMVGYAPTSVAIMLHTSSHPERLSRLLAMVDEAPEVFEAYQDNHPAIPEATLKSRSIAASFVVDENAEGRFVGLYEVAGWTVCAAEDMDSQPIRRIVIGLRGRSYAQSAEKSGKPGRAVFDLRPLTHLADLRGRLIVSRSASRTYMRLAENCNLPVVQIERDARFAPPAPNWDGFVVSGEAMRGLPRGWQARLREWRGIYLIVDQADGARYVGAAYGDTNLLGRWQAHVAGDLGVTVELGSRDPVRFRFSILELVAPTAPVDLVQRLETSWKNRLATREWGLNRN